MEEPLTRDEAIAIFERMTPEQLDQARRLLNFLTEVPEEADEITADASD